ncbi:MAG: hypothetical protein HC845_02785 [Akkermansiaceae bacterium]|nr:hypothetical protein [Akkermansiaceae bacterium]
MIPKRWFISLALFIPATNLMILPLLIYYFDQLPLIAWILAVFQLAFGLFILNRVKGKMNFSWPFFVASRLRPKPFSWLGFTGFLCINLFVLVPFVVMYLVSCASVAVSHFTDGFVSLRPEGLVMQVRNYVRDDGKKVQLAPMSHVGEATFYQSLNQSFPDHAVVLMEGVTDQGNLLQSKTGYSRMAKSLGVSEQQHEFKPKGELVAADVDIRMFNQETLDLIDKAMLIHSKGMTAETLSSILKPTPEHLEKLLWEDLLTKRNAHLLEVLHARLPQSQIIIVPWGALHMPEISEKLLGSGFRVESTEDHVAIRFSSLFAPR